MGHYLLSAEAGFSAAHHLPGIDMCDRFHGHNWRVRLTVRVDENALDDQGMGVDFRAIETAVQHAVSDFEHRHLNDLPDFREQPPTAERIAKVIHQRARERLGDLTGRATIAQVEVWEMPEYRVIYREP
jgi:6-pyruvoyltetrahydropterin/6-carboxytetrahydropterin synthase